LKKTWEIKLSGAILAPAVAAEGFVYICSLAALYKLDGRSGEIAWEYPYRVLPKPRVNSIKSSPAIMTDRIVFTDMVGTVYCLDTASGESIWESDAFSAVSDSVAIFEDRIYANGRRVHGDEKAHGYICVDRDGALVWFSELSGPNRTPAGAIADGKVVCGDMNGYVYGLDVQNGDRLWRTDIKPFVDKTRLLKEVAPRGIPVVVGGLVIVRIGDHRNLCALDLESGEVRWTHVSDKDLGYVGSADCLAADDRRVFYTMRNLFRSLDLESGEILLTTDNSDRELGSSQALSGIVVGHHYIAGFNMSRKVVAFNVETGEVEWEFTGEGGFTDEATYFDGGIVIGDDLGYVRRFAKGS
jgi:outer membrane protein assembly factor BamB